MSFSKCRVFWINDALAILFLEKTNHFKMFFIYYYTIRSILYIQFTLFKNKINLLVCFPNSEVLVLALYFLYYIILHRESVCLLMRDRKE